MWMMQVMGTAREKNSALEVEMDFDHVAAPPPVITEEVTASLEDTIKKRIAALQVRPSLPLHTPTLSHTHTHTHTVCMGRPPYDVSMIHAALRYRGGVTEEWTEGGRELLARSVPGVCYCRACARAEWAHLAKGGTEFEVLICRRCGCPARDKKRRGTLAWPVTTEISVFL